MYMHYWQKQLVCTIFLNNLAFDILLQYKTNSISVHTILPFIKIETRQANMSEYYYTCRKRIITFSFKTVLQPSNWLSLLHPHCLKPVQAKVCTSTQTNQVSSYGTCQVVITFFILFDTKITHQTLTKRDNNLIDLSPSIAWHVLSILYI